MSTCKQRQTLLTLIGQSCDSGARLQKACALIGLGARTVQRWRHPKNQQGDLRVGDKRRITVPPNKLSEAERQAALELLNSEQFKDLPPSQIVPRLADQGLYVASESTLYRLLREVGQLSHRRPERVVHKRSRPRHAGGDRARPGLLLGYQLLAHRGARHLPLPLPVRGPVQPPDRGLAGVRLRERRTGQSVAAGHLRAPGHRAPSAYRSLGQRLTNEGGNDARHHAAPGRGCFS